MSPIESPPSSDPQDEQTAVFPPWTPLGDRRGKNQSLSPIVTIFGGGIAGLSAAHELIERGFSVQVVESTPSQEEEYAAEVGGLARNQFGRVRQDPLTLHGGEPSGGQSLEQFRSSLERIVLLRSSQMQPVQKRFAVPWRILFDRQSTLLDPDLKDQWDIKNAKKLANAWETLKEAHRTYREEITQGSVRSLWWYEEELPRPWVCREILYVEIRGHTDGDGEEKANRALSKAWAEQVRDALKRFNDLEHSQGMTGDGAISKDDFDHHFTCVGVGSAEPLGDQSNEVCRRRSNRVEFRIAERLVPGEHGYRFFPAFYRHLFDTMRRTPILDEQNRETGQTAFDRLVATQDFGLALQDGLASPSIQTRRVRSLEELRRHSELFFTRLGVSYRDLARFQVRLLKFLTSSSERRQREYEGCSWWRFLDGDAERGYSPRMTKYLLETPQALVAMNAKETDARSQGNIVAQLLLHYMVDQFDMTLNGPTTQVWLHEWKRYLKRQGVRFFVGELGKLAWLKGELVPLTMKTSAWLEPSADIPEKLARVWRPMAARTIAPETDQSVEAVPKTRPPQPTIEVEVLDSDAGDYTIVVGDRTYWFTAGKPSPGTSEGVMATGQTCEEIAGALAKEVDQDADVSAKAQGTRIVITEERYVRRRVPDFDLQFDESINAGSWERSRTITREDLLVEIHPDIERVLREKIEKSLAVLKSLNKLRRKLVRRATTNQSLQKLLAVVDGVNVTCDFQPLAGIAFEQRLDEVTLEAEKGAVASAMELLKEAAGIARFDDHEWVYAGRLRAEKEDFDRLLRELERARKPRRELVPRIKIVDSRRTVEFKPPLWVEDVDAAEGPQATDFAPLFPYYFRIRGREQKDPSLLIRVRNAHGNLRILSEPDREDPTHDYMSHSETRVAFRPDFYILALPFAEASKLVWRAETQYPGQLDGCLAELLEFDRRTYRRSPSGVELRLVRDQHGRPPQEYPLRDFSGVQYYFHNHVRIGKGHIYYPDAEWGLSSISQLAYWRERMAPTGPFMGQLSVDIGNFYRPAPPRRPGRIARSAWHSTFREIVAETWHQVRQGLERERAGVLAAPDFVHLDEWLRFDHPRGSSFRDQAAILVRVKPGKTGNYTVWINGECFVAAGPGTSLEIAKRLQMAINRAPFGSIEAAVERKSLQSTDKLGAIVHKTDEAALAMVARANLLELDELEAAERDHPKIPDGRDAIKSAIHERRRRLKRNQQDPDGEVLVRVCSRILPEEALVFVTGADAGSYELSIGDTLFRYAATPATSYSNRRTEIRNGLFEQLVRDLNLAVTPAVSGETGLLLQPRGAEKLPPIKVKNDHQNLSLVFGPTLHIRLDQSHNLLSFDGLERATIGYNEAPFLINVPAQWKYRPGVHEPGAINLAGVGPDSTHEEPVFYRMSNRRWVAVGTFMATTTRLTTMEAANESARHAVNSILRHLGAGGEYNAQGRIFGDLAEIWDPEKNELDDLEPLKRLDKTLLEEGLPHVLDILKLVETVDALPMQGQASPDPMANVLHLLRHAGEEFGRDWGFSKESLTGLIAQAAVRAHDQLDPLGILKGLKGLPTDLAERIQRAVRSFMDDSGRDPSGAGKGGA